MKKLNVLKRSLGIDVSKRNLSICLGVLNEDLEKDFVPHPDVSNDKEGFKILSKWLKSQGFKNDTDVVVIQLLCISCVCLWLINVLRLRARPNL
jgi:hypothetical protein